MNRWIKNGLIFAPPNNLDWMNTHALAPVADQHGEAYRVYFSGRDKEKRGRLGSFVLDLGNPRKIAALSHRPVLDLGPIGTFDDHGVTRSCVVTHKGRKYLHYNGWNVGSTVPFYIHIGLAISDDDGGAFRKYSPAPILDRNAIDPCYDRFAMGHRRRRLVEDVVWLMLAMGNSPRPAAAFLSH